MKIGGEAPEIFKHISHIFESFYWITINYRFCIIFQKFRKSVLIFGSSWSGSMIATAVSRGGGNSGQGGIPPCGLCRKITVGDKSVFMAESMPPVRSGIRTGSQMPMYCVLVHRYNLSIFRTRTVHCWFRQLLIIKWLFIFLVRWSLEEVWPYWTDGAQYKRRRIWGKTTFQNECKAKTSYKYFLRIVLKKVNTFELKIFTISSIELCLYCGK